MFQFGNFTYLGKPERNCAIGETCEDDHIGEWWVLLVVFAVAVLCQITILRSGYGKHRHKILVDDDGVSKIFNYAVFLFFLSGERKCTFIVLILVLHSIEGFTSMMIFFQALPEHKDMTYIWAAFISLILSLTALRIPQKTTKSAILGQIVGQQPMEDFTPRNVYQDFSASRIHVSLVFILQLGLFMIYFFSAYNEGTPCFNHWEAYLLMWLSIFLRAIYSGIDAIYRSQKYLEDVSLWNKIGDTIWYNCQDNDTCFVTSLSRDKNEDDVLERRITKWEWQIRHFMEIFVNSFMDIFLSLVVIVQATNGDWKDFVFNFVAVRFILELDDYSTWNVDNNVFRLRVVSDMKSDMEPQEIVDKILRVDYYKSQFKALIQTVKIDGKAPYSSSQHAEDVIQRIDSGDEMYSKDQLVNFVRTMESPPPSDLPVNLLHGIIQTLTNADKCQELTKKVFPGREIKSIPILRDEDAILEFIQRSPRVLVNKILTVEEYKIQLITLIEKAERPEPESYNASTIIKNISDPTFKAQVSDFIKSHFQVVELVTNEDNFENLILTAEI